MTTEICEKCNTKTVSDRRNGDSVTFLCLCNAKPDARTHHADGSPATWTDEHGYTSADWEYWSNDRR